MQRNRIASTGGADRLPVDGGGAVLANYPVGSLVEADGAANLAGIKHRSDSAIWLLIQPEADGDAVFSGLVAMQVSIGNLGQGNADLPVAEGYFGGGRQGTHAFCIDEFGSDHDNEQKRTG